MDRMVALLAPASSSDCAILRQDTSNSKCYSCYLKKRSNQSNILAAPIFDTILVWFSTNNSYFVGLHDLYFVSTDTIFRYDTLLGGGNYEWQINTGVSSVCGEVVTVLFWPSDYCYKVVVQSEWRRNGSVSHNALYEYRDMYRARSNCD